MIAISIVTFLLFIVALPGGNPASQIAGRLANPAEVHLISVRYGFDKPIWVQYVKTMENIFEGKAYSYSQSFNVLSQIGEGLPATLSLALGAGIFWLFASIALGTLAAIGSGKYTDRVLTVLSMIGVSMPPFLLGAVLIYYVGFQTRLDPVRGIRQVAEPPSQLALAPARAVVHAVGPVHRLLLARAARLDPRHAAGGLRPHRPRQGSVPSARCC